jgi:hypothetical protein
MEATPGGEEAAPLNDEPEAKKTQNFGKSIFVPASSPETGAIHKPNNATPASTITSQVVPPTTATLPTEAISPVPVPSNSVPQLAAISQATSSAAVVQFNKVRLLQLEAE